MCDVLIATGEVEHQVIDIDLPGYPPFEFWRLYGSFSRIDGPMGARWRHSWERYLTVDGESVNIYEGLEEKRAYPIQSQNPAFLFDADRVTVVFKNGSRFEYRQRWLQDRVWNLIWHEDPHGLHTEFRYSSEFLSQVLDAYGRDIQFRYDGRFLAEIVVRTGNTVLNAKYLHDSKGQLIEAVDALGRREVFDYDGPTLVSHLEKRGARRHFAYDWSGRCTLNWYEGNKRVRNLRWSVKADRVALVDSNGIADVYHLDSNRPIALIDPLNRRTEWVYDSDGALLCRTMPDGRPYVLSSWDAAGDVLKSVDLRGAKTEYYFENGQVVRITNATGASLTFGRSNSGDITSLTGPDGSQWRFEYDGRGALTRAVDPQGYWIVREESRGRITVRDQFGEIGRYEYDDIGNLLSIAEADCGELRCSYVNQDKPAALRTPDGSVVQWSYDSNGRIAEVIDGLGRRTRFRYTLFGSTSEIEYADGTRVRYIFDEEERLKAIINTKGEVTSLEYDIANRVSEIRFFDGRIDRYRYDELNRVVEVKNESGTKRRLEYDESVNPVVIEFPGGIRQQNTFDELNHLTRMQRSGPPESDEDAVIEFKYNSNGLIIGESDGKSLISYRMDACGKLIGIEDESSFSTEFDRDARGRPVAMRDPSGAYAFHYGLGNQLLRMVLPNGAEQHFGYDRSLRQTSRLLITAAGDVRCSRQYRYDAAGQLVWMKDWRLGVRTYEYDRRGRLIAVRDERGHGLEEYAYDSEGNILRGPEFANAAIGPGNRVMSASSQAYSYDEDGRLVATESKLGGMRFHYGPFNTLREAVSDRGHTAEYRYDLLGRRTDKKTAADHVRFRHHGNRLVRIASKLQGDCDFTYAPDTLVPIAERSRTHGNFYYTFDQIGTPTEVWDEDCNLIAALTATVYGSRRSIEKIGQGADIRVPFHFLGQIVDEETELHYNRFRYYWPLHGRYTIHDPIGLTFRLNLYSYARDPLTWVDPFGLNPLMLSCGYADGTAFDPCEQYAAQMKLDNINAAAANRRKKTCTTCREDKQKKYFTKTCGGNPAAGNQVDHSLELQLGGADYCCDNLIAIPGGVNQSFGSQIKNLIAGFPEGAVIPQFAFNPPGCNQAHQCTDTAKTVQRGTKSDGKDCGKEPPLNC